MGGICYIVGAGPIEDLLLKPSEKDFIIAADAGYLQMAGLSAVPDLVVGDFDSMGQKPNHPNVVVYPKEKDATDMLLAIDEGLRRGYRKFVILGGLGGRLDHTLANIQALSYIAQKKRPWLSSGERFGRHRHQGRLHNVWQRKKRHYFCFLLR